MFTLGIDTSNYATSIAVYDSKSGSICVMEKQFLPVPKGSIGIRQSDAVYYHTIAMPILLSKVNEQFSLNNIQAIAVSKKPRPLENSHMPCFEVGYGFAKAISLAKGLSLIETTHQQGHIAAAIFGANRMDISKGKLLVFHVSGGTTDLLLCENMQVVKTISQSADLYAGQAVDRLGVKLGFDFPAGVEVSKLAINCNDNIKPRSTVKDDVCHLSGLENLCDKLLSEGKSKEFISKFCLLSIAETLQKMLSNARGEYGNIHCICAGGVMSSEIIAEYMIDKCDNISFAPAKFSSDNAAGVALIAAMED